MKKKLIIISVIVLFVIVIIPVAMYITRDIKINEVTPRGNKINEVTLEIIKQDWTWTGATLEQPSSSLETKTIKEGDVIILEFFDYKANVTIKNIKNNTVNVDFKTDIIVTVNENGNIDLNSNKYEWSDNINYNSNYSLVTQTMDVGTRWTLTFKTGSRFRLCN